MVVKFNRVINVVNPKTKDVLVSIHISRNDSICDIQPRVGKLFEKMYGRQATESNIEYVKSIILDGDESIN